jgi:hypothetical protein
MYIQYYPNEETVKNSMQVDDPLLMLVSYDNNKIIISNIDDTVEHHILLKVTGHSELDIDKYFRVVVNSGGADWTFVCLSTYKNISDKTRRIECFYKDGILAIDNAIKAINYDCEINIPNRYRRHFDILKE